MFRNRFVQSCVSHVRGGCVGEEGRRVGCRGPKGGRAEGRGPRRVVSRSKIRSFLLLLEVFPWNCDRGRPQGMTSGSPNSHCGWGRVLNPATIPREDLQRKNSETWSGRGKKKAKQLAVHGRSGPREESGPREGRSRNLPHPETNTHTHVKPAPTPSKQHDHQENWHNTHKEVELAEIEQNEDGQSRVRQVQGGTRVTILVVQGTAGNSWPTWLSAPSDLNLWSLPPPLPPKLTLNFLSLYFFSLFFFAVFEPTFLFEFSRFCVSRPLDFQKSKRPRPPTQVHAKP